MKIDNVEISGLEFSKKSAGLPKGKFKEPQCWASLANAKAGSGHDVGLIGVVIHAKITASQTWWMQFKRYHHWEYVSSTSKMHSILTMEPTFHPSTSKSLIAEFLRGRDCLLELKKFAPEINEQDFVECLAMSVPMGMELTAGIVTNLLQLKTIWGQRRGHKLSEWRTFCTWIDALWQECEL